MDQLKNFFKGHDHFDAGWQDLEFPGTTGVNQGTGKPYNHAHELYALCNGLEKRHKRLINKAKHCVMRENKDASHCYRAGMLAQPFLKACSPFVKAYIAKYGKK